jgi:sensor histidine kinase regulating citrate/malate metabolism
VTNDFAGALQWEQGAEFPTTSKQDKSRHGLGLMNIARCAEKYQGTVDIETKEESGRRKFFLVIMLYQRSNWDVKNV